MELDVSQPDVAIGARGERGVILLIPRMGKARCHRHAVYIHTPGQLIDSLAIRNIGGTKTEIALRGGEGELAVVLHRGGGYDEAIGKRRSGIILRAEEAAGV